MGKKEYAKGIARLIEAAKVVAKVPDHYGSTTEMAEVRAKDLFALRDALRALGEDE